MNNTGWIKIHRQLKEHWLWADSQKFLWWIDMLMSVNFEPKEVLIGNKIFICERGQSLMSLDSWARQWRTTKRTVKSFFELLESQSMIRIENLKITTRITICKYESYQSEVYGNDTSTGTGTTPQREREVNANDPQLKNVKNYKNDNNDKECKETNPSGNKFPGGDPIDSSGKNDSGKSPEEGKNSPGAEKTKKSGPRAKHETHPAYALIVDYWLKTHWIGYQFGSVDGRAVKGIILKIENTYKAELGNMPSPDEILESFALLCTNLPEFYKTQGLPVLNNKYNEIIAKIKNVYNGQTSTSSFYSGSKYSEAARAFE